jgi:hypothetical protein
MLRSPSEYESTRIELSSRVAKVENLYFDSAIIFFTPKVANKGVDLASLQCTIVQITDRGAWGKEEETFTVDASSFNNRKYRLFDLTTDAEYSLKILPPPELRMGILEIYFDPNQSNIQSSGNFNYMPSNNPVSFNPSDLTTAFSAALAGNALNQAQATAAAINNSQKTGFNSSSIATAKPWTGNIADHKIFDAKPSRLETHVMHTGKNGTANSNSTVFMVVGDTAGKDNNKFDHILTPLGDWTSSNEEDVLPVYAWVEPNKTPVTLSNYEVLPPATA